MIYILFSLIFFILIFAFFAKNMRKDSSYMSKEEAKEILGVHDLATKEDITTAFNTLMKKNHPDVGGSKYLAQKIIIAKKTLIDE